MECGCLGAEAEHRATRFVKLGVEITKTNTLGRAASRAWNLIPTFRRLLGPVTQSLDIRIKSRTLRIALRHRPTHPVSRPAE
jgi:hypothetical protein